MKDIGKILVIGAGPTGLGAAWRLEELGADDYLLLEAAATPGGLAASFLDDQGFTWDIGGHVQFSHYAYYDAVLDRAVKVGWLEHERESWVWVKGRWVPYPFQNNIHRLPEADCQRALAGLERAAATRRDGKPAHFQQWIDTAFGAGIAEIFANPYNFKVWGYPPDTMGVSWQGERVAVPDVERIKSNIREGRDDVSWGPNNRFRFPLHGGTGEIWRSVAGLLPQERLRFGARIASIDLDAKSVRLDDESRLRYDHLVTSMPLDLLCSLCAGKDAAALQRAASGLIHSSVHILGIGLRGDRPETLRKKCWMYFPESHSPYYRVTVFSNYSPRNAPDGDGYWSLMAEVCESPAKPVDAATLRDWTLAALRQDRLIGDRTEIVSFWRHREEHGYPTPFRGRDEVLGAIRPVLEARGVYSRGRFGAWKYEVSNQD
ncbi:MAG TPA: FAD-dependent oxidoreductase, partial [Thermoanaerobaculia bacterium]|nr:FAD-dependent oxidoreductase [Thermoanaerobaculia bacterium]